MTGYTEGDRLIERETGLAHVVESIEPASPSPLVTVRLLEPIGRPLGAMFKRLPLRELMTRFHHVAAMTGARLVERKTGRRYVVATTYELGGEALVTLRHVDEDWNVRPVASKTRRLADVEQQFERAPEPTNV